MTVAQAQKAIESLRMGIPPNGYVRHFTVGRESEINQLLGRLRKPQIGALLLKANYGSGKSHLLRFLRETALEEGYAVSSVTLDSKSAVRFNKMDQILGAIWRGMEVPGGKAELGIRAFFDLAKRRIEEAKQNNETSFWYHISSHWKWDHSEVLASPGMFVALRAWLCGIERIRDLIQDWLFQPWVYHTQRKYLYEELVSKLRGYFRDPRADWMFYKDGVFAFNTQGYQQSWAMLRDIQALALNCGLKGFIVLFDEFEDVLTSLTNVAHQESAFWNLFQFYAGNQFPAMTFFAVTPEFADKCKVRLMVKGRWDYDYSRFDQLPTFAMSPLEPKELEALAKRIMDAHGIAYSWEPDGAMKAARLRAVVNNAASVQVQDRARHTITEVVKVLDQLLEDGH